MHPLTRRSFVAAGAAIPLSLWIEQSAAAPTKPEHVRHDARSPNGKAMLKKTTSCPGTGSSSSILNKSSAR